MPLGPVVAHVSSHGCADWTPAASHIKRSGLLSRIGNANRRGTFLVWKF